MNEDFYLDARPLTGKLKEFQPLSVLNVNKTEMEPVWDYMVRSYHYLGYDNMIGPRIKYLVLFKDTPIAALSYNRATLTVGVRDSYIGWDTRQKHKLLKHVVNNNRFLILPWVKIKNLASHLLSHTLKMLREEWPLLYGSTPYLVESFVDRDKYKGTCYQAANWRYLGETKGFAKVGKTFVFHGNRKGVYVYLLNRNFIEQIRALRCQPLKKVRERVPNMMLHTPDWSPEILEQAGITTETVEHLGQLLDEYLAQFSECYSRSEQRIHGECYVKGLLSNLDRKSMEPIALRYEGEDAVRGLQNFFKDGIWDDEKMLKLYHKRLSSVMADPLGMINVDGCDNPKKGKNSVGVKRQYCGPLGKRASCQAGIFIGYSSSKGYGLIERKLFMPKEWFDDSYAGLRQKCGVPEGLEFRTKIQIASELINKVISLGDFPAKWIGADGGFGEDKVFLDSIPEGYHYFATVPSHTSVWLEMPEVFIPDNNGHKGRQFSRLRSSTKPILVSSIADDDSIPWQRVILAEGAKGPIFADVKCLRAIDSRDVSGGRHYPLPNKEVWLYIRRFADGRIKHALCNAPADTSMETLNQVATMRWPIEQCFEECKSYLGMDHCEARSWNSWHRHMLFVFIAHLFLQEIRLRFKKKLPILTVPQAQLLIVAAFTGDRKLIEKAIGTVMYRIKHNYAAYISHRKKALQLSVGMPCCTI